LRCQRGAILKMGAGLVNHFHSILFKFPKINKLKTGRPLRLLFGA